MVKYKIVFTKQASKEKKLIKQAGLEKKVRQLLTIISLDPFQNPPPYEKLVGNFDGLISRRINIKHRLVYQVYEEEQTIKILSLWSRYERL